MKRNQKSRLHLDDKFKGYHFLIEATAEEIERKNIQIIALKIVKIRHLRIYGHFWTIIFVSFG